MLAWSQRKLKLSSLILLSLLAFGSFSGCSSTSKNPHRPRLNEMHGRKVALVEIEGESTARRIVEVALVNQLVQHGSFELISKQALTQARTHFAQNPTDLTGIARRAGADYALVIRVLRFSADNHKGYSKKRVYDSQMAEDRGEEQAWVDRLIEVQSLEGEVELELKFISLEKASKETFAQARETKRIVADNEKGAIRLPPKLRFLEQLTQRALERFFEEKP